MILLWRTQMRIRPRNKKIRRGCRTTSPTTLIWLTRTITATNEERLTKGSKTVSKMRETRGLKIKEIRSLSKLETLRRRRRMPRPRTLTSPKTSRGARTKQREHIRLSVCEIPKF